MLSDHLLKNLPVKVTCTQRMYCINYPDRWKKKKKCPSSLNLENHAKLKFWYESSLKIRIFLQMEKSQQHRNSQTRKKGGDKERLSANKTITLYGWGKIPPQELFSPWMTRRKPKDSDKLCNVRFVHICLQFKDIATKLQ